MTKYTVLMIILMLSGCISTGAAPTAAIQTRVPAMGGTITTEDGILTVGYPVGWTAESVGARVGLSSKPGIMAKLARETLRSDELVVDIAYVARDAAAAALELPPDFTLDELAEQTANDLVEMTTETLRINDVPAIGQTGLIAMNAVVATVYAVTFELEGMFITVTTYAGEVDLTDIRGVSTQIAASIVLDVSQMSSEGAAPQVTAEG